MAHGIKPYGRTQAEDTIFGIQDMRELAASLGSIRTFDGRGNILWLDDFEATMNKWLTFDTGGTTGFYISPDTSRNGAFSARIRLGGYIGNDCYMQRYFGLPHLSRVGFELSFTTHEDVDYYAWRFVMVDGADRIEGTIRYYELNNELQYIDDVGVFQHLAFIGNLWETFPCWHTLKFVIDLNTQMYVRLMVNENAIDISHLPLFVAPLIVSPQVTMRYHVVSAVGPYYNIYADDAIFTQNEP